MSLIESQKKFIYSFTLHRRLLCRWRSLRSLMDRLLHGADVQLPVPRALQKAPRQLGVLTSKVLEGHFYMIL